MVVLHLCYNNKIKWIGFKASFPENWQELSYKQLCGVSALLQKGERQLMFEAKVILLFLGVKWWHFFKLLYLKMMPADAKLELHNMVAFTHTTMPQLEQNPLPKVKIGKHLLYGPGDWLKGIRTLEFFLAIRSHKKFVQTKNPKHLHELLGQIYRPALKNFKPLDPEFDADIRQEYNQEVAKQVALLFSKLPVEKMLPVLWYFEAGLSKIVNNNRELFPQPDGNNTYKEKPEDLSDLLLELAGNDLGKVKASSNERLSNTLMLLKKNLKDTEKKKP